MNVSALAAALHAVAAEALRHGRCGRDRCRVVATGRPHALGALCRRAQFETYEQRNVDAIKGGFLDTAEGAWLSIKTASDYNTPRQEATYAPCAIRLVSTNPNPFTLDPDDLTVLATSTCKTYRNTGATPTDGAIASRTLSGNGTLDLLVLAEEAGSGNSANTGEIDTIVSPAMFNVTVTNTTPAIGLDAEKDPPLRTRARGKLGALSPNGTWDGYR